MRTHLFPPVNSVNQDFSTNIYPYIPTEQLSPISYFNREGLTGLTVRDSFDPRVYIAKLLFQRVRGIVSAQRGSTVVLSCCDLSVWKMAVGDPGPRASAALRNNKTEALRRASKPGQIRGRFSDNFIAASRRIKLSFEGVGDASLFARSAISTRAKYGFHRAAIKPEEDFSPPSRERVYVRGVCVKPVEWHCVSRYL